MSAAYNTCLGTNDRERSAPEQRWEIDTGPLGVMCGSHLIPSQNDPVSIYTDYELTSINNNCSAVK